MKLAKVSTIPHFGLLQSYPAYIRESSSKTTRIHENQSLKVVSQIYTMWQPFFFFLIKVIKASSFLGKKNIATLITQFQHLGVQTLKLKWFEFVIKVKFYIMQFLANKSWKIKMLLYFSFQIKAQPWKFSIDQP